MQSNFTDLSHPHENQFISPKRTLFFAIAIMVFGFIGVAFIQILEARIDAKVTSYESCVAEKGSTILESYPAVCVSASGKRFVQPLTDEEQRTLVPPTEPTATPQAKIVTASLPLGWKEVPPDPATVDEKETIHVVEYMKVFERRLYPIGRISVQYSETDPLELPHSLFPARTTKLFGMDYGVLDVTVSDKETGETFTEVYVGKSPDKKYNVRIFLHYQSDAEHEEQKKIIATLLFSQDPTQQWKTYTSERYRFTFQYPPELKEDISPRQDDEHIFLEDPEKKTGIAISVEDALHYDVPQSTGKSIQITKDTLDVFHMYASEPATKGTIQERPFLKSIIVTDHENSRTSILDGKYAIRIDIGTSGIGKLDLHDKILSTFQFTE